MTYYVAESSRWYSAPLSSVFWTSLSDKIVSIIKTVSGLKGRSSFNSFSAISYKNRYINHINISLNMVKHTLREGSENSPWALITAFMDPITLEWTREIYCFLSSFVNFSLFTILSCFAIVDFPDSPVPIFLILRMVKIKYLTNDK